MSATAPASFEQLAEPVRRWIWQQKWSRLRDVQEKAVPAILAGGDVVISARTAAGKTEAAFLPLISRILADDQRSGDGFAVLYVSPLKALINDQARRLASLLDICDMPLHRWHGDVAADVKRRARERPSGIVLITPESLEATLVRRGRDARKLFGALDAVVIDELHAFIGAERGIQLQSILNRIEVACERERIDRIGLSATLGDMTLAAEALRPGAGAQVRVVEGNDPGNGLKLQIKGYAVPQHQATRDGVQSDDDADADASERMTEGLAHVLLAKDLFRILKGRSNLLFAGSRRNVEIYADELRAFCDEGGQPNEFFPHHGNLSKLEREELETRLRDDPRPTTAVATTTLELGIDIGDVETVAQIGPGFAVASLRQRLGRSGRRDGKPAILRMFILEDALRPGLHPLERLRLDLVQAIAMVECLRAGWCEPPRRAGLHLSTLIHQTLALIMQVGAVKPTTAWNVLCGRGPFQTVSRELFGRLLRVMGHPERELITMSPDGLLMIGRKGEFLAESHEFYAVFETPEEYRIVHGAKTLGTYPTENMLSPGQTIIFGGRRWRILVINDDARVIEVTPTRAALPPTFGGGGGDIHDRIVATMQDVLTGTDVPVYLDVAARDLLDEARSAFFELGLDRSSALAIGKDVCLLPWVGTRKLETLALALLARGFKASPAGHAIFLNDCTAAGVHNALGALAVSPAPTAEDLAERVAKPHRAKYDHFLSEDLMQEVTIVERLEVESVPGVARRCLAYAEAPPL